MIIKRQKEFTSRATKALKLSIVPRELSKRGKDVSKKYISKNAKTVLETQQEQVARLSKEHLGRGEKSLTTITSKNKFGKHSDERRWAKEGDKEWKDYLFKADHYDLFHPQKKYQIKKRIAENKSLKAPELPDAFKNGRGPDGRFGPRK